MANLLTVSGVWWDWGWQNVVGVNAEDYLRNRVNKAASILVVFRIAVTWYLNEAPYRKEIYFSLQFHGGKGMVLLKAVVTAPMNVSGAWGILLPTYPTKKKSRKRHEPFKAWPLQWGVYSLLSAIRPWFLKATQTPKQLHQMGPKYSNNKSVYNLSCKPQWPWPRGLVHWWLGPQSNDCHVSGPWGLWPHPRMNQLMD